MEKRERREAMVTHSTATQGLIDALMDAKGIIYMSTVKRHTLRRLESFIDAIVGKRLTYAALIAKVGA